MFFSIGVFERITTSKLSRRANRRISIEDGSIKESSISFPTAYIYLFSSIN